MMVKMVGLAILLIALAGCSTTYKAHEASVANAQTQLVEVEKQKVEAKKAAGAARAARAAAIAQLAASGSDTVKVAALMALAFDGVAEDIAAAGGLKEAQFQMPVVTPLPSTAERLFVKAFDGLIALAPFALQGYIANVNSDTQIAISKDNSSVLTTAFGTTGAVATAGFQTASNIAGLIQAPAPNVTTTLSGTGVIGSGSYTAPVTTVNRNCTSGSATGTTNPVSGGATC
jgi:hypothetical protein